MKVATELQVVAKGSRVCYSTIFALAGFLYCSYKRGYSHTMERQMRQKSENTSEFRKSIIVFAKSIVGGLRVSVNTCTVEEAEKLLVTWLNRPGAGGGEGAGGGSMLHK